jgi:Flp pilus assembly protein TadG
MMYNRRLRRGAVAVLVAVCLIPMLAVVAIVLDGGVLLDDRRQAQTAADAAALAAATDLFNYYKTNQGADPGKTAKTSALTTAKADGYNNDGTTSVVTVNIPPKSGPFTGKAGYVEILITYNQPRFFSNVLGSGSLTVTARAVARGLYTPSSPGILVLDPTGNNSLDVTASGGVTVTNGGAIDVDSNSASGGLTITNTGNVTADTINLSDNTYNHSNSGDAIGTINYKQPATPDPLALLPEPSQPSAPSLTGTALAAYSTNNGINYSGTTTLDLYPGYYPGLNLSSSGGVVLHDNLDGSPGIYYIGSHGLSATNAGGISGSNVMIYSAGTGNISLTGSGNVTLSPPTTGTYEGITLFQERSSTKQVSITAQGNMTVSGTFYAAAAKVAITGQGNFTNTVGSQWIAYDLAVTGSGSLNVSYNGLASPLRQIQLVE